MKCGLFFKLKIIKNIYKLNFENKMIISFIYEKNILQLQKYEFQRN